MIIPAAHWSELAGSMIAQLIPLDGSQPFVITRDLTLVGRKRGLCDLILDNSSISKLHCAIAKTDGLLFIRDLGSTNGTKVNGQRVTRGALLPGDELSFASSRYRVYLAASDANSESADSDDQEASPAFRLPKRHRAPRIHGAPENINEPSEEACLSS